MRAHEVERLVPGGGHRRDDVGREARVQKERRRAQEHGGPRQGLCVVFGRRPAEGRPVERPDEEKGLGEQDRDEERAQPEAPPGPGPPHDEPPGHEQEGEVAPPIPARPLGHGRRGGRRGDPGQQGVDAGERRKEHRRDHREEPTPQAGIRCVRRQAQGGEAQGAPQSERERAGRGGEHGGCDHAPDAPHRREPSPGAIRTAARRTAPPRP